MVDDRSPLDVLHAACRQAKLDAGDAEPIRLGENAIYRLPGGVVARVARSGQLAAAEKEVRVARWLERQGVRAVAVVDGIAQPVDVDGRAVTFWRELPPHRHGTAAQVATALRQLHDLEVPTDFELPPLAPFVRLAERIDAAATLTLEDRAWLRHRLDELERQYQQLPAGLPPCAVHGDAWVGNVVSADDGNVYLLDLERFSIGPPEWDLVSVAIKHTSFGWLPADEYEDFTKRYGHDVTAWEGFETLRDIRELRMTSYVAQHAAEDPTARPEAVLRVSCLQGHHGPRPWPWTPAL